MSLSTTLRYGILSQGAAAPWTPADIADLRGWWGDNVNSGVDRKILSNGANITQWDDMSGNNFHAGNLSGSTPTYNLSNDWITSNGGCLYNYSHSVISGNEARIVFWVGGVPSLASNAHYFKLGYGGAGSHAWSGNYRTTEKLYLDNAYAYFFSNQESGIDVDTPYLQTWGHPASVSFLTNIVKRYNGVDMGSAGASRDGTSDTLAGVLFGGDAGPTIIYPDGVTSHWQEFIVYNRFLDSDEIDLVEAWLANKYSISI